MTRPDGPGSIYLFSEHNPNERVRQRNPPKRPALAGSLQYRVMEAIWSTDDEACLSALHLPGIKSFGDHFSTDCDTSNVQRYQSVCLRHP
jgi:hypothetical protein